MQDLESRNVICGANAYEKKYYFNEKYNNLPDSIKEELRIICVLFTEEIGGVFTLEFDEDGGVEIVTDADEHDYLYDEIGSGLLVGEIRRNRQELFEALSTYYKVLILKQSPDDILSEE